MRWGLLIVVACIAYFAQQASAACNPAEFPVGGDVYNVTVPSGAVAQTKRLFPEGNPPLSATFDKDVKITFTSRATMAITFMWEGAGYRNKFGYFLYNPTSQTIIPNSKTLIFPDVSHPPEGCMVAGLTVNVSRTFNAGDVVGFYVLADGYPNVTKAAGEWYSIHGTAGVNNSDGKRHTVWTSLSDFNDVVLIGFEDLKNLGDNDFNDVMFYLTINGSYEDGDIPVYNNGTLEVCEPSEILEYNEFNCTQYALLTARNPLACNAYINVEEGWEIAPDNAKSRAAIKTFGDDAGCIVLASGNGYNSTGQCASNVLKNKDFSGKGTCFTVGCDLSILVIGDNIEDCTGQTTAYCDPAVEERILSQFPSADAPIPVFPSKYGVYLNRNIGAAASQALPFRIDVPDKAKVDVMILVDYNGLGSFEQIKSGLSTIHTSLTNAGLYPSVGLSWLDANGNVNVRPITATQSTLVSQGSAAESQFTANTGSGDSRILRGISGVAASSSAGWRPGSFRFIAVITTRNHDGVGLADAKSAQLGKMFIPVFLSTENYGTTASDFVSGRSSIISSSLNNWVSQLRSEVFEVARRLTFTAVNDLTPGFLESLPASSTPTASTQVTRTITVRNPASLSNSVQFPYTLNIIVWGFGSIEINIFMNRAPTVVAPLPFAAFSNATTAFSVTASDMDNNNVYIVYRSVTPSNAAGLFTNSRGGALTGPNTASTDFGGVFSPNGWAGGNITINAVVGDGCANVSVNLLFITLPKPNDPPASSNARHTIAEDTTLTFNLPALRDANEIDPSVLLAIVEAVNDGETRGYFYTDSTKQTKLVSGFVLTSALRTGLFYEPPANTASNPANSVLASFDFRVQDPQLASSRDAYTVGVVVTPVNDPPTYTGETIITIDEDTTLEISLRDYITDIDSDVSLVVIRIGTTVQRGNLYECEETDTGCNRVPFTAPYELSLATNPSGRVVFVPLADEFGDNYASFQLWANDGTDTAIFTITINVRPVNDPPVIHPFFNVQPIPNEMDEDTELVLSWNVTDIDSPVESLTIDARSFPTVYPGKLYLYVQNGDSYTRGDEIEATGLIPRFSPGVWKVIVVPNANIFDNNFVRYRLTAYDDVQAPSLPVNAPVRVLPINDAPVISANEQTLTRTDSLQITLGFIAVSDIDAGRFDVAVSFSVQDTSVGHFGFDALTNREANRNPCVINADNTSVVCTEGLSALNEKWFKLIVYYPGTTGSQVITVFADDLGHTDKWDRPLNDTKLVLVNIGEDTGLITETGDDNTLTIAVAVSVAGAVGAVALVLFLVRDKLAGQTDAYFDSLTEPISTGGVSPIYQAAGISGQNPTYIPQTI